MDAVIKLFLSLKLYWKIILATFICNSAIIYLICFLIVPAFKDYPLSIEILLSIIGAICYSTMFYLSSNIFLVPYFFVHRLIEYNTKCLTFLSFIISTLALIFLTSYEFILIIFIEEYSFNIKKVLIIITACLPLSAIMAPIELHRIKLAEKRNKKNFQNEETFMSKTKSL